MTMLTRHDNVVFIVDSKVPVSHTRCEWDLKDVMELDEIRKAVSIIIRTHNFVKKLRGCMY